MVVNKDFFNLQKSLHVCQKRENVKSHFCFDILSPEEDRGCILELRTERVWWVFLYCLWRGEIKIKLKLK